MKRLLIVTLCFALFSGCGVKQINYKPDITNVVNPIPTLKETLEQQPPAYAYVPFKVEVTDQFMALYLVESGIVPLSSSSIVPTILYYKNLGDPRLSKSIRDQIWQVQIYDKFGNDLYWVYTDNENEAKSFLNALVYMIEKNR